MKYRLLAMCLALGVNLAHAADPAVPRPQTPDATQAGGPVFVSSYVDVRPALTGTGRALVMSYVRATRADAGNVEIHALQEIDRGSKFVIIETWKDQKALADHEQAAHTEEFRAKLKLVSRIPYDRGIHHGLDVDPMPGITGSNALYVVTHVDVRSQREFTEGLLKQLAQASRTDPGHLRYDAYQQEAPRTNHFTLFAVWNNRKSFDAYGAAPHWQQFVEGVAPLLGAPYDDRLYTLLKE